MNIAILMMQKNESELLDKWLRYHGYLVGFENLYVYDNGSESQEIISLLEKYQQFGVNVDFEHNQRADFEGKGDLFCERIQSLEQSRPEIDFYIPLDCDEFLGFLDDEGNVSCDPTGLRSILALYKERKELLLIDSQYYNNAVSDVYFNKQPYRKCFFYKNTIKSLDVGFHWGKVKTSEQELTTRLVHFHFHNKPFTIGKAHAKEKLKGRVKDFEPQTIAAYRGAGLHLVRFFTQNESSYVANQLKQSSTYSAGLKLKFEELGIHWPYFDEMNQSRKNMGLNEQTDGFENVARYFNGSIDFIGFDSNTLELTIKGWAVFQQSVPVDRVYFRFASGKEAEIVIRHRKNRDDVAKLLNMNQSAVGFEEKVKIDKSVVLEPEFSIVAKSDYQCRLYPLDVNRKYRSLFVSENDQ